MGQEQSSSGVGESSSLLFLTQKARGISPKPNRNVKQVVVVKSGAEDTNFDIQQDEDFLKLQKIPLFYPILRNSLNIPGIKDPADYSTKFDHRAFSSLCHRFQDHLVINSELICGEQANLGARIREIDYAIATLSNCLTDRHKQYAKYMVDLNKIREINNQLMKVTAILQEIVPMAESINELLPEADRLPPLDLGVIAAQSTFVPEGTDEQKVVDQNSETLSLSGEVVK